jgi:hypothetical protein
MAVWLLLILLFQQIHSLPSSASRFSNRDRIARLKELEHSLDSLEQSQNAVTRPRNVRGAPIEEEVPRHEEKAPNTKHISPSVSQVIEGARSRKAGSSSTVEKTTVTTRSSKSTLSLAVAETSASNFYLGPPTVEKNISYYVEPAIPMEFFGGCRLGLDVESRCPEGHHGHHGASSISAAIWSALN